MGKKLSGVTYKEKNACLEQSKPFNPMFYQEQEANFIQ